MHSNTHDPSFRYKSKFCRMPIELHHRKMSVAPMMDWTDRHCRYFHRLLAPSALLYTEMVTANAILYGDVAKLLDFDPAEHPVALQLGGSEPEALAKAAVIGAEWGYDEINLNVGCPSDRVQSGRFGACLMAEPELVADCVAAMRRVVDLPVTVKHRIGIDDQDEQEQLRLFVDTVRQAGCDHFIVHARKAWLEGLSPKENRDIPPLNYPRVYQLKQEFPDLHITINGGLTELAEMQAQLQHVDGVMLGRAAYQNPYLLAQVEQVLFGTPLPSREQIVESMQGYIETHLDSGGALKHVARHLIGLFQGVPGAKYWRRYISQHAHIEGADGDILQAALLEAQDAAAAALMHKSAQELLCDSAP